MTDVAQVVAYAASFAEVAVLLTAVATTITAVGAFILARAQAKALETAKATKKTVDEIDEIVNSQKTNMENFQRALIRALKDAGVAVPIDQSLPEEEGGSAPNPDGPQSS